MPGIRRYYPIDRPNMPATYQGEHPDMKVYYDSSDEHYQLIYHSPYEWHMGATGWQISITLDGDDITPMHSALGMCLTQTGAMIGLHQRPWSFTSEYLSILA